jgi:hypothetical protein
MAEAATAYFRGILTFLYSSVVGPRTETVRVRANTSASAGLTPITFTVQESQRRGGRKGGLPVCECNGLLANAKGRLPRRNGKRINEAVAGRPKQFIGQVAMNEQQSSMGFSEDGLLWGQQSMSSIEDDIFDMSADFAAAAAAAPPVVGSTATDRASKRSRMVRPRCIVSAVCTFKIADFRAVWSSDDLALAWQPLEGPTASKD